MTSKRLKMCKKALVLFFAFLFSINSFAAVVSDNDGAAFVTKAEFEALKDNFVEQINNYNKSIDSKIDGAIGSYLAGINLAKKVNLVDEIKLARNNNRNNTIFAKWNEPKNTNNIPDVNAAFFMSSARGCGPRQANAANGYHIISNVDASGNLKYKKYNGDNNDGATSAYISSYYYVNFPLATLDTANYVSTGNTTDWSIVTVVRKRLQFKLSTIKNVMGNPYVQLPASNWQNYFGHVMKTFNTDFTQYNTTKNGPGEYEWPGPDSAKPHLFTEKTSPDSTIEHTWTDSDANDITNNGFLNYNLSGEIPNNITYGVDYNFRDNYVDGENWTCRVQKNLPSTATHEGGNSCSAIVAFYYDGSSYTGWDTRTGLNAVQNDVNFYFKWNHQKVYSLNWKNLTNTYYIGRLGKAHYKYYGIPICRTTGEVGKLKLKLKFTNTRTDTGEPLSFVYQIMDTQFPNGTMPETLIENNEDHVLKRATVVAGNATKEVELELDKHKIYDKTNGDYIYIKVEPAYVTQRVEVETIGDIIYTEEG